MRAGEDGEDVWRREAPHVLTALVRRYGDIAGCEDAVQEALIEASRQWRHHGVPERPRGWLLRVASRRLIDARRQESARRAREGRVAHRDEADRVVWPEPEHRDDSLEMLALCCHPALTPDAQVTLALRAVLGLSTRQVAAVYLIPEATAGQRISRAKSVIDARARTFPGPALSRERLSSLLQALYLMFTAGHHAAGGPVLADRAVTTEAIRLAGRLHAEFPDESETAGLLALMLVTDARRHGRFDEHGDLVPLEAQDRRRWDHAAIAQGARLLERALPSGPVGPYQLQAAIAAVHGAAPSWEATDWPQIVELYAMLARVAPSPTVTLNFAVALSKVRGPAAALRMLDPLTGDDRMRRHHRFHAARAALLEADHRPREALQAYRTAGSLCTGMAEQRFLNRQITRLVGS